jgi:hypothetical protein
MKKTASVAASPIPVPPAAFPGFSPIAVSQHAMRSGGQRNRGKHRRLAFALSLAWILAGSLPATSQVPGPVPSPVSTLNPPPGGDSAMVVFYADPAVSTTFWPALFVSLRRELAFASPADRLPAAALMTVAGRRSISPETASVIVVHLLGRCDQPRQAWRPLAPGALGWVYKSEGRIQPSVWVDCTRIAQLLDPLTLGMSDGGRVDAMDTAIARVLLHEWIHISLQTADHMARGIRQPRFSASDLLSAKDLMLAER